MNIIRKVLNANNLLEFPNISAIEAKMKSDKNTNLRINKTNVFQSQINSSNSSKNSKLETAELNKTVKFIPKLVTTIADDLLSDIQLVYQFQLKEKG